MASFQDAVFAVASAYRIASRCGDAGEFLFKVFDGFELVMKWIATCQVDG